MNKFVFYKGKQTIVIHFIFFLQNYVYKNFQQNNRGIYIVYKKTIFV